MAPDPDALTRLAPAAQIRFGGALGMNICDVTRAHIARREQRLYLGDPTKDDRYDAVIALSGIPRLQALVAQDCDRVDGVLRATPTPDSSTVEESGTPTQCIVCGDVPDVSDAFVLSVGQYSLWLHDDCRDRFNEIVDGVYDHEELLADVL